MPQYVIIILYLEPAHNKKRAKGERKCKTNGGRSSAARNEVSKNVKYQNARKKDSKEQYMKKQLKEKNKRKECRKEKKRKLCFVPRDGGSKLPTLRNFGN